MKRLAVAAFVMAACHPAAKTVERPTVSAPTAIVQTTTIATTRAIAGTVRSDTVSTLSANVVGTIAGVDVAEGDRVRAGQIVVRIDPREGFAQTSAADSAVSAAKANANVAETTYQRFAALFDRHAVSRQELEDVIARRDAARAELARAGAMASQARTVLAYRAVRSPIDGIVTARHVDAGAQAAPGVPLVTIEDPRAQRIEATVPEDVSVKAGDAVTIEASGERFDARVTRVQPTVDAGRASLVKIAVDRPLRSGAYVRVLIRTGQRNGVVIPDAALVRRGALTSVFVVGTDGVARMRLITLGEHGEVLSGIDAGERIVVDAANVRDGVRVS